MNKKVENYRSILFDNLLKDILNIPKNCIKNPAIKCYRHVVLIIFLLDIYFENLHIQSIKKQ